MERIEEEEDYNSFPQTGQKRKAPSSDNETLDTETAATAGVTTETAGDTAETTTADATDPNGEAASSSARMNSRMQKAMEHIKKSPYSADAWTTYLQEGAKRPIEEARETYEKFLEVFPSASKYWKLYIESEISARNYERVEELFKRCLFKNLDIELWKSYIKYIKLVKSGAEDEQESLSKAFEFVLKHMGADLLAAQVWRMYVMFMKNTTTHNTFEEGEKVNKLRKIYQRAIVLPVVNVDALWREYDVWEHSLNKVLAKSLLADHQPKYLNAKVVCRERKRLRSGIIGTLLARPPEEEKHTKGSAEFKYGIKDYQQVVLWQKCLDYELSNPQGLDPRPLKLRVVFAYKQALLTLRHYPEIWYGLVSYCHENGYVEEAAGYLYEACLTMPYNIMIHFIYADFQEERKLIKEARAIYQALIDGKPVPPPKEKTTEEGEGGTEEKKKEEPAKIEAKESAKESAALEKPKLHPLVNIQYMRFARRTEGVDDARKLFVNTRAQCKSSYETVVAAALMEYHQNKYPKVALKLFSNFLDDFIQEPAYVKQYLCFLDSINDHNNMRVVFERVFSQAQAVEEEANRVEESGISGKEKSIKKPEEIATMELWDMYVKFERMVGDISAIEKAEKRRSEFLKAHLPAHAKSNVQELIDRYTYLTCPPLAHTHIHAINSAQTLLFEETSSSFDQPRNTSGRKGLTPTEAKKLKSRYPRPNINKMTIYKPGMTVKGAREKLSKHKKFPEKLQLFVNKLPAAVNYTGPIVDVDKLLQLLMQTPLPPLEGPSPFDLAVGLGMVAPTAKPKWDNHKVGGPGAKKTGGPGQSSDNEPGNLLTHGGTHDSHAAPQRDIYRRRQQQKSKGGSRR